MTPSQSASILSILLLINLSSSSDYTSFVFKGCADQKFPNSEVRTLKNLLETLTSQSSAAKFYRSTSGAITGLFQCRGDLSSEDCSTCVRKASSMAKNLCGRAAAARVELKGCYTAYEVSGSRHATPTDLLYKVCGSNRVGSGDRVEAALGEIAKGVARGFYAGGYGSVYVLGQCEGDLGGAECVECVEAAVGRAKSECGGSISAQIYLEQCYISYTYYPDGVPGNQQSFSSSGRGRNTQKTVAIAMGGLAGAGLITACLLFAKSAFRKKSTHTYKYGG